MGHRRLALRPLLLAALTQDGSGDVVPLRGGSGTGARVVVDVAHRW